MRIHLLRHLSLVALILLGCRGVSGESVRWRPEARRFELAGASGTAWLTQGHMCVALTSGTRLCSDEARYRAKLSRETGVTRITFTDSHNQLDLSLALRTDSQDVVIVSGAITNRSTAALALDRIELLVGKLADPREPDKWGVLQSNISTGERRKNDQPGVIESYYTLALESPAFAGGFLTGRHNINRFRFAERSNLTAWGECDGALLPPGQSRDTDTLFLAARGNPLRDMERFADMAAKMNQARVWPTSFATWCTWYAGWILERTGTFRRGLEKGVEENIEPVKQLRAGRDQTSNYAIRICDDLSMYGDWNDSPRNIPSGLTRLADLIRSAGLVPGVWYVPYWVLPQSRLFKEHPEWMARNADGSIFRTAPAPRRGADDGFAILDTSRPEVMRYFEQMSRRMRERGFRYVTTDFLIYGIRAPKYYDPTKTKAEIFRMGMEATRRGLGDDVYYRTISALYGPSMGLSQDMRVGADSFGDVVSAYDIVGSMWFYNRRLWINDPESIVLRQRDSQEQLVVPDAWKQYRASSTSGEYKSDAWSKMWASWIALSGTVMTFGDRLAELPEPQMSLYRRVFPPLNISGRPLDLWENKPYYLWGLTPTDADGPYSLFGVFELAGNSSGHLTLNLDEISARSRGWEKPTTAPSEYLVWDFWAQKLVPSKGPLLLIPTPSKSGRLFALRARLARPQLVSTSGHFSQGMLETSGIRWDTASSILSGRARGNGNLATTLYFHVPAGMKLAVASLGGRATPAHRQESDIIAIEVPASSDFIPFQLTFSGTPSEALPDRQFRAGRAATRETKD